MCQEQGEEQTGYDDCFKGDGDDGEGAYGVVISSTLMMVLGQDGSFTLSSSHSGKDGRWMGGCGWMGGGCDGCDG
jgi:hypothetical protein